jgi:hypothetical protein
MQRIVRLLLCGLACALTAAAAAPSSSVHIPPGHTPFLRPSSEIGPNNVRVDRTTDCAIKSLALEYATQLQGNFQPAVPSLVHDALQLGTECNLEEPIREQEKQYSEFFPTQLRWRGNAKPFERPVEDAIALWVDGTNGESSFSLLTLFPCVTSSLVASCVLLSRRPGQQPGQSGRSVRHLPARSPMDSFPSPGERAGGGSRCDTSDSVDEEGRVLRR